jgi:hypothetical protein
LKKRRGCNDNKNDNRRNQNFIHINFNFLSPCPEGKAIQGKAIQPFNLKLSNKPAAWNL